MESRLAATAFDVEDVSDGVSIVNDCLGLRIPTPEAARVHAALAVPDGIDEPERRFGRLMEAILDAAPSSGEGWLDLLPRVDEVLADDRWIRDVHRAAIDVIDASDAALARLASTMFDFVPFDLPECVTDAPFIFGKLNHGFWEYVTLAACAEHGRAFQRTLPSLPAFHRSRVFEVVGRALNAIHVEHLARGLPSGTIATETFAFGLSFHDGNRPVHQDLTAPMDSLVRDAVIGCSGFFAALGRIDRWRVVDGGAPKSLVWSRRLDEFCARVIARSEALLFIVPPHLSAIAMRGWSGPTETLVVPFGSANEQWLAALPLLAGAVSRLSKRYDHLTVLVQAGELAALLAMVLALHRSRCNESSALCYLDMGQALDVAVRGTVDAGPWIRRPDIAALLAEGPPVPFFVR